MDIKSYLMGIIDGEGCVSAHKNGRGYNARVGVQISNQRICELLQETWGGSVSEIKRKTPLGRTLWAWDATGKTALPALRFMSRHSNVKKNQANLAITMIETLSGGSSNCWGVRGIPDEVIELRESIASKIRALNQHRE